MRTGKHTTQHGACDSDARDHVMKVATWNLERGGRTRPAHVAQEEVLLELGVDVIALTEPPATYRSAPGVVASAPRRSGPAGLESWVAVVGETVEPVPFEVPYERMAVAARATVGAESIIIYGAVLPWLAVTSHAPYLVRTGEDSMAVLTRVLAEQIRDVTELQQRFGELVVWAGDFNQTLAGPLWGGSAPRRALLAQALASIGYGAWNEDAEHATDGMRAVDLICGPREHALVRQGRIDPGRGDVIMSDHAGYWVETM